MRYPLRAERANWVRRSLAGIVLSSVQLKVQVLVLAMRARLPAMGGWRVGEYAQGAQDECRITEDAFAAAGTKS